MPGPTRGKLDFGSSGAGSAPHLAAELFCAMAASLSGTKRNPQLPDVPSVSQVIPGTPAPVAQRLAQAMSEIVRMADVQGRMLEAGDESFDTTPAQMAAFLREESQRWGDLIKTVGITAP